MTTHNKWAPRINLRARELTALEEKVLRMRYGLPTATYSPLPTVSPRNAQAARTLAQLEAKLHQAAVAQGGRRRKLSHEDLTVARAMLKDPTIPVADIAKRLGVSRATFYIYFPGARSKAGSSAS